LLDTDIQFTLRHQVHTLPTSTFLAETFSFGMTFVLGSKYKSRAVTYYIGGKWGDPPKL